MSETEDLIVTQDGGVLTVTLNRPERLNALSDPMREAMVEVQGRAAEDDDIRVIVITGAGRGFCTGADLTNSTGTPIVTPRKGPREPWYDGRWRWITGFRDLEKPVVTAINGVTAGAGIALATVADVRFASDLASFVPAFMQRAILPDAGSSYLLSRTLGPNRMLHMLYDGERVSAEHALQAGMIEEIVPHDQLMERVNSFARKIATGPAVAIELTKRLAYRAWESPSLSEHAQYEQYLWTFSRSTSDYVEGRRAFQERRSPNFTGGPVEE